MSDHPGLESPTLRRHKQQRSWQIIAPVILVLFVTIALGVYATCMEAGQARLWADVAAIWLLAPLMLFALLGLALLGTIIYLLARLMNILPSYTLLMQDFAVRLAAGIRRGADAATSPVVWLEETRAALKMLFK